MAKPKRTTFPGHKVIATVKSVKGNCSWGHEAGDTSNINCHDNAGLCGYFYHDIFPYIIALQFGGSEPWGGSATMVLECMDRRNAVKIELRRED